MRSIHKKLIFGLLVMAAGGVLIVALAGALFLGNHSAEYREFSNAHTGELARVRAMMRPAPSPAVNPAHPAAQRDFASTSPAASVIAGPTTKVTDNEIMEDASRLTDEEWMNIKPRAFWEISAVLPAGEAGARPSTDNVLRRRIREEILYRALGQVRLFDATTVTTPTWIKGSAPLTTRTEALLGKTEAFLAGGDWGLPDFNTFRVTTPTRTYLDWSLADAAMLRRGRAGDADRAALPAERYLDFQYALRVLHFPAPMLLFSWRQWVLCNAPGAPGEAALTRLDAALRRRRLDARQLADLRAAHVMRLREMWRTEDPHPMGHDTRLQWMMDTLVKRFNGAVITSAVRPTALAWTSGNAAAVYQSLLVGAPLMAHVWSNGVRFFPPELAAGEPNPPVNLELDLTRLAVAAARYRLAHGAYPTKLDDLIPHYLESDWRGGGKVCWMVDELEAGIWPDLKNGDERFRTAVSGYFAKHGELPRAAEALRPWAADDAELQRFAKLFRPLAARPVFYQARRVTLPRECAPAVADVEDRFLAGCLYDNIFDWDYDHNYPGSPTEREILRRLREGRGDTDVWVVRGFALLK
jgi:hypothetical protein